VFSLFLFAAGVLPFAVMGLGIESGLRAPEFPMCLKIVFASASTLAGVIAGTVGALSRNSQRLWSAGAAVINAVGLVFMLNRFLLWGV
jgi:hypothetical protein